jgi:hypothetical protein
MLSELRRQAGQARYEVDIAAKLQQMFADGELPAESDCVGCGVKTENVLRCSVECERTWTRGGGGFWKTFFLGFFVPWQYLRQDYGNPEVVGRELVVQTPIRYCDSCWYAMGKKPRKRQVVDLLRAVPMYNQLLLEYPSADVSISKPDA